MVGLTNTVGWRGESTPRRDGSVSSRALAASVLSLHTAAMEVTQHPGRIGLGLA